MFSATCSRRRDRRTAVLDATQHCHDLAFVMSAYAHGVMAGIDEANADWSQLASYRGQNATMHSCDAMLAADAATGEARFLSRAETIAWNITRRQAGHFTEWAKLLLLPERHEDRLARGAHCLLPTAQELFDQAMGHAWDLRHGGIGYGFALDGCVCDGAKHFRVQTESLAAAALPAVPATPGTGSATRRLRRRACQAGGVEGKCSSAARGDGQAALVAGVVESVHCAHGALSFFACWTMSRLDIVVWFRRKVRHRAVAGSERRRLDQAQAGSGQGHRNGQSAQHEHDADADTAGALLLLRKA